MGEPLLLPGFAHELTLVRVDRVLADDLPESAWMTRYLDAAQRARARMRDPHAPTTRRAYWHVWRRWGVYCGMLRREPLPVDAELLCAFLELLSDELSPNSVRLALAAVCALDRAHRAELGEAEPRRLRRDPRVEAWLKAWSRDHPIAPRREAPAMTVDEVDRMLALAAERPRNVSPAQHIALYTRDRALLLLGLCAALRVSELAELELGDVTPHERGLQIRLRRSKTDQRGRGHTRAVMPQARLSRCPIEAHRAWLQLRGDAPGALYCRVSRAGALELGDSLTVRQVQQIVTARARAAGVVAASGHTLRATFATLAASRGKPLHRIADQGGWSSLDVLRRYVRQASLFDDNASSGLLE